MRDSKRREAMRLKMQFLACKDAAGKIVAQLTELADWSGT
jgi:hypothetical protein